MTTESKNVPDTIRPHLTNTGGCYFASNYLTWAVARTPWEAIARLTLSYDGRTPALKTEKFKKLSADVRLYYVPTWEDWSGPNDTVVVDQYRPVNEDGTPAGILLYGGPENERFITNYLNHETLDAPKPIY